MNSQNTWLFASTNKGKLKEIRSFLEPIGIKVLGISEVQELKSLAPAPEVIEDGLTYIANAKLKAEHLYLWSGGMPTLADDSGLEVDALDGQPGLNTARYSGENATPASNIEKLLSALAGEKNRKAKFICALYLKIDDQKFLTAEGTLGGEVALEVSGDGGFGYDPVVIPEGFQVSLASIKGHKDSLRTHRVRALENLVHQFQIQKL